MMVRCKNKVYKVIPYVNHMWVREPKGEHNLCSESRTTAFPKSSDQTPHYQLLRAGLASNHMRPLPFQASSAGNDTGGSGILMEPQDRVLS